MSDRAGAAFKPIPETPWLRFTGFFGQSAAVARVELWKLRRDPTELLTRAVQPTLWLVLFGNVMAHVRGIAPGGRYLDFMAPGILAQSVLFAAIFYGISAIWERDLGILHRYMVSPAPRAALVLGKAGGAAFRGLVQAIFVYALTIAMGIGISLRPINVLGVAALIVLGSALFSMMSLIIACIVITRDRFMGIGQVITMPIFFASNAIYPLDLMPAWLRTISAANPLTYEVDALRALMLDDGASQSGVGLDFGVLIAVSLVFLLIAARLYPRMTR